MGRHSTIDGAYEIASLPSQAQIAVCHAFFVHEAKRGKGLSHGLKEDQNAVLSDLGYDYALCTVASTNEKQKAVLNQAGWRCIDSFYNRRLSEQTELWSYQVP